MNNVYTDTHAHLTYSEDAQLLSRLHALYADSSAVIIDPGVDFDDFDERYERLGSYPWVRFAAGIWPDEFPLHNQNEVINSLEATLKHPACKLVGECGLDYYWMKAEPQVQQKLFIAQLDLACFYQKPIIVHSRDAWQDTINCLKPFIGKIPIIFHCFSYGRDELKKLIHNGIYVSFSGNITYKRMKQVLEEIPHIPEDLLLLETDTPYQNPEPNRGKPSTPFDIVRTYEAVSSITQKPHAFWQDRVTKTLKAILHEV